MRYVLLPALAAGLFLFVLPACSSSNGGSGGNAASSSSSSGTAGGTSGCPGDLAEAPNSAFCADSASPTNCALVNSGYHNQVCGVPVIAPTMPLTRSSTVMEFAGSGPPQLGCFAPSGYPKMGVPQMVTMSGVAKIFSSGCESNDLSIEVYTVKRTGGSDDADLDTLVGTAVMTPDACTASNSVASTNTNCGTRYECNYSYPNVPTETEFAIRTQGSNWAPLIEYNDYIPNAQVMGGVWTHDVRALASDDYETIPQAAIGSTITLGNGAVAGEVHDCGNVRLTNATVDINAEKQALTYFTSNEESPLPDTSATGTSDLGLYAALDTPPGEVGVAALGLVDGKVTTVGYFQARVFANSVTAVTFQGVEPFQVPQQ